MRLNISDPNADVAAVAENVKTMILRDPYTNKLLRDKDGSVSIDLVGAASGSARKTRRTLLNDRLRTANKHRNDDDDESDVTAASFLASLTRGWSGIDDANGPIPFTRENATRVYLDREWIRKQVDAFVSELSNFSDGDLLGNSPRSSSPPLSMDLSSTPVLEEAR